MTRPRRILHLLPSLHVGGVGRLLVETVSGLDRNRFTPAVAYFAPPVDLASQFQSRDIPLFYLGHRGVSRGAATLSRLRRLIRSEEIDLVHTHLALDRIYGGIAARTMSRPVVTTLHWSTEVVGVRPSFKRAARNAAVRQVGRFATTRFIAVSRAVRDHHVERAGVPAERVSVVYPGIDCREMRRLVTESHPDRLRAELGIDASTRVLLNVGRLIRSKGQRHLVEMLQHLPDEVVVAIAGEGPERANLTALSESLHVERRVRLLGMRDDIPALLALADAFVFPTSTEGLPIAVIEALAAGTPVITSRIPVMEEVIRHEETGLLIAPCDSQALAEAASRVMNEPTLARRLASNGRQEAAKRFDQRVAVARLEDIYQHLLRPT